MTPAAAEFQKSYSPSDVQAIVNEALADAERFVADNDVLVVDPVSLQHAARVRTAIGAKLKKIRADIAEPKGWAFNLHKWITGLEKAACVKYEVLDTRLQDRIRTFKTEEDRRRHARERELAQQLKKEADDRAIGAAAQAAQDGQHKLAESIVANAIATPVQAVSLPDTTKVEGQSYVRRWRWRLTLDDTPDVRASLVIGRGPSLLEAVERLLDRIPDEQLLAALGPALAAEKALIPRAFLSLDEKKVDGIVESMKEGASNVLPECFSVYYVDDPVRR